MFWILYLLRTYTYLEEQKTYKQNWQNIKNYICPWCIQPNLGGVIQEGRMNLNIHTLPRCPLWQMSFFILWDSLSSTKRCHKEYRDRTKRAADFVTCAVELSLKLCLSVCCTQQSEPQDPNSSVLTVNSRSIHHFSSYLISSNLLNLSETHCIENLKENISFTYDERICNG